MLLHLSDLHFGTQKQECLDAIRDFCHQNFVEAIAVSGDLTQRAKFKEFFDCKMFLDSLNLPYLVVPGNHDIPLYHIWRRVFGPFLQYKAFFGQPERTLETENFYLVGVNSIRRRHHTKGKLSSTQIKEIDEKLAVAPVNKIKLIVVHQPFYASSETRHDIKDCPILSQEALKMWGKHGLFGLLHGHLHQSAVYDLNQIFNLGLSHAVLDIHAGTATSYRLHHGQPNGFNVIYSNGQIANFLFNKHTKQFEQEIR